MSNLLIDIVQLLGLLVKVILSQLLSLTCGFLLSMHAITWHQRVSAHISLFPEESLQLRTVHLSQSVGCRDLKNIPSICILICSTSLFPRFPAKNTWNSSPQWSLGITDRTLELFFPWKFWPLHGSAPPPASFWLYFSISFTIQCRAD